MHFKKKDSSGLNAQNLTKKWSKADAGCGYGHEIEPDLRDQVLQPLIDQLKLSVGTVFDIVDGYFCQNTRYFHMYHSISQEKNSAQKCSDQQKYARYVVEVNKVCEIILNGAKTFYFEERNRLLNTISALYQNCGKSDFAKSLTAITTKLEVQLVPNLIESLVKNLEWETEFEHAIKNERAKYIDCIQSEQICMLLILHQIFYSQPVELAFQKSFLDYLQKTDFIGNISADSLRNQQIYSDSQIAKSNLIKSLGQLAALDFLLPQLEKGEVKLDHKIDQNSLSQASSFVYLPLIIRRKQTQTYNEQLKKMPLLEEYQELLTSELLTSSVYQSLKGSFKQLLQRWLDALFTWQDGLKQGEGRDSQMIEEIRRLGLLILKDRQNIEKFWKAGVESLQMFKEFFNNPKLQFEQLLPILDILCGSHKAPTAKRVLTFLEEKSLLKELYAWLSVKLQKLNNQQIQTQKELATLSSACCILAKIIKQQDGAFDQLNEDYVQLSQEHRSQELQGSQRSAFASALTQPRLSQSAIQVHLETGDYPLLALLIRMLHAYFNVNQEFNQRPLVQLINALGAVFKIYPGEVIAQLLSQQHHRIGASLPIIIEYCCSVIPTPQNKLFDQKICSAFLKFLTQIFQNPYPQVCLDRATPFNESFLAQALQKVYTPLLQNYMSLQFANTKSLFTLTFRLLRLTDCLFEKFKQVKDNGQKQLLAMPHPKLDLLYKAIVDACNSDAVYQIALRALQLSEGRSSTHHLENRFTLQHPNSGVGPHSEVTWQQKMTQVSIMLLNTLLELSTDQSQEATSISRQTFYVRQLLPVQKLHSIVLNLTTQQTEQGRLLDLTQLMTFYVRPSHPSLDIDFINAQAIKFLTISMQIIKTDLLSPLKHVYGLQLNDQLMKRFRDMLNDRLPMSQEYIDFWCVAIDRQPRLVDEMFNTVDSDLLCKYLNNGKRNIYDNNKCMKLVVMVALMATKPCCRDTVEYKNHQLLTVIWQKILGPMLDKQQKLQKLDGNYLFPHLQKFQIIDGKLGDMAAVMNFKITISYFLQLVQSEFQRVPTSIQLRSLIHDLHSNKNLQALGLQQERSAELLQLIQRLNNDHLIQPMYRDIVTQSVRHTQLKSLDQYDCPVLKTDSGYVQISEDMKALSGALCSIPAYQLMNTCEEQHRNQSRVGSRLAIDVDELQYVLEAECYSELFQDQVRCLAMEYNIVLSDVFVDQLLLNQKADYFTSVCKTQMRQVQTKVDAKLLTTASMLPHVSSTVNQDHPLNNQQITKERSQLKISSKEQIKMLLEALSTSNSQSIKENYLFQKLSDAAVNLLQMHMGVVNHLLDPVDQDIKNTTETLLQQLPDIVTDEEKSQKKFSQLACVVFQILGKSDSKPQEQAVLKTLARIVQSMKQGHIFSEGLEICNMACDVLDSTVMHQFMRRQDSSVLKMVLFRLNDNKTTNQQVQEIISLLQTYAKSKEGSLHLYQSKLLETLQNSQCLKRLNEQDLYIILDNVQVRNQVHMHWLQIILLVKQMNANLITSPSTEHKGYFRACCTFIRYQQLRFLQVLSVFNNNVAAPSIQSSAVVSLAIFEEIELVTSLLQTMFEHANFWAEIDPATYCTLKDAILFQVPGLLKNQLSMTIFPSSVTEQYLTSLKCKERSMLNLKVEMSLVKIVLNCSISLYNVLGHQKQTNIALLNTWHQQRYQDEGYFQQTIMRDQRECPVSYAFENYLACMETLRDLLQEYRMDKEIFGKAVEDTAEIFINNQQVQSEYQNGLGTILVEESLEEICVIMETALRIGVAVLAALLENVRMQLSNSYGYGAPQISYFEMPSHYQSGFPDERSVVHMGMMLKRFIQKVSEVEDLKGGIQNPDEYLKKLDTFAQEIIDNPTNQMMMGAETGFI